MFADQTKIKWNANKNIDIRHIIHRNAIKGKNKSTFASTAGPILSKGTNIYLFTQSTKS